MATKSDQFKSMKERSGPKKAPAPKRARGKLNQDVDTSEPGVSASDRRVGKKTTAVRNVSARAGRKAGVMLEASATTPSRKSTRRSANRGRASSNLERASKRERTTPEARAQAAQARAVTVKGRRRG